MSTDPFTQAARAEALSDRQYGKVRDERDRKLMAGAFITGAEWGREQGPAQEESVLMTLREETISDRLSDAGYTEYAEDEDGGVTWVSAPLGEVLRIVSAAQEPTDAEVRAAADVLEIIDGMDFQEVARAALTAAHATR